MVQSIGDTLSVGRDAVYRRLRGDTVLTADELIVLARKYRIPVDEGRDLSDVPKLYYQNGAGLINNDYDYFYNLIQHTTHMVEMPGVSVDYATPELSIFYELALPVLRAFKVYVNGITTWRLTKWDSVPFRPELISPETNQLIDTLIDHSFRLPGRELWSIGILDVTLRQITYMAQVGKFANKELIETIFDEIFTIVEHLEKMARSGKRFRIGAEPDKDSPTFQVYHNELSNTNNAIIIKSDTRDLMFSTIINPNYVMCDDPRVLDDVKRWFDRLVANGNVLNAEAGKYTAQYFGRLHRQVKEAKSRALHATMNF